ncbi:MAG: hypothetical protein ACLTXM_14520 [Enterococcus sp.]
MITLSNGSKTVRLENFKMRPLRDHSRPRSGKIEHNTMHVSGQSGDWYFGSQVREKEYELQAYMEGASYEELETQLDLLNELLFDADGQPQLLTAKWDNTKKIAYVRLAEEIIPDISSVLEKIPIKFVNHDSNEYAAPSAYDPETPLKYNEGNRYGAKFYPNTQSFQWVYSKHYSAIENHATMNAEIKIIISGSVKGGSVKHLPTGKVIKLPDVSNRTITIDSETYSITIGTSDVLDFDASFFKIGRGTNGFLFEASEVRATVRFEWYHKFM